jgi:hypothetical protein
MADCLCLKRKALDMTENASKLIGKKRKDCPVLLLLSYLCKYPALGTPVTPSLTPL